MQASSLALILVCLAGPGESPNAEDRPVVQVPRSRAEPEPAIEPVAIEHAPAPAIEPTPELPPPSVDPSAKPLPNWREAPVVPSPEVPATKPKLPEDGGPAIALGSMAIGVGSILIGTAIAMAVDPGPPPRDGNALVAALGGLYTAGGAGLLTAGVLFRNKFRKSELGRARDAPPTGRAMHAAGATLMAAGAPTILAGTILVALSDFECFDQCQDPGPVPWTTVGLGVASLVTGSALLIVSQVRGTRYRRWMTMRPSFGAGPQGAQLGLAGRF